MTKTVYDPPIEEKVLRAADTILRMYKEVIRNGVEKYPNMLNEQAWYRQETKQTLRDCLEAMKIAGLIENYSFSTWKVTMLPEKKELVKGRVI